jgi:hypothetical protein
MREALKHKKYDPYVHPFSPNQTVNDRIKKAVTKQDVENAINETLKELDIHNTTTKNIIHWFNTLKHNSIKKDKEKIGNKTKDEIKYIGRNKLKNNYEGSIEKLNNNKEIKKNKEMKRKKAKEKILSAIEDIKKYFEEMD